MKTVESVLSELYQAKATDIAHKLRMPLEQVYERLIHLDALGVVKTVPAPGEGTKREWRLS